MTFHHSDAELEDLVQQMTLEEKVDLVSGQGLWRTAVNYRLNVPETVMTDGTNGVRYSADQIDRRGSASSGLTQFLEVVNKPRSESGAQTFGSTKPATVFPSASCIGCSWDEDLLYLMGQTLASECQHYGVNMLLGPGVNIRRTPLAGRAYEYHSEDPLVNGTLAAALINGLQDHGVGASLKHLACNNSEIERTTMSSDVDERALREIYLRAFEAALERSTPWSVMSSYNRLNGEQTAHSKFLLTDILRDEWGYGGLVVSDWYAIKDRPASLRAGNDLDMPESVPRKQQLLAALEKGEIEVHTLDRSCLRVLRYVRQARQGEDRTATAAFSAHHAVARELAAESVVLARNNSNTLPLVPGETGRVLVLGAGATAPVIQGSGSATTRPAQMDVPLDYLRTTLGQDRVHHIEGPDVDDKTLNAALGAAEAVVIFTSTTVQSDGEGADRRDLNLAALHDALIHRVARFHSRVIVVVASPDAVELPWLNEVGALLVTFFPGQGGGKAISDVLCGLHNPSGKLTVSFPARKEDIPGFHTYPGENGHHIYSEGHFVGYRFYDLKRIEPAIPFGHGLSYTAFEYDGLRVAPHSVSCDAVPSIECQVRNTGARGGKEVVQLYIRPIKPGLSRPVRELKGFRKISLAPGERKTVRFELTLRDFQYWDPSLGRWALRADGFVIEIGASSRDIRLSEKIGCDPDRSAYSQIRFDTQPTVIFKHPSGRHLVASFLVRELGLSSEEAERVLKLCEESFVGLADTLNWFFGAEIEDARISALIDEINRSNS